MQPPQIGKDGAVAPPHPEQTTPHAHGSTESSESAYRIAGLGVPTSPICHSFVDRHQNVVFQGFTGSGKSYLGCALAKQACTHRIRAHYIRMPDLAEAWAMARDKSYGTTAFLKNYAAFTLLVLDEWLLDPPDEGMRSMLLELLERRYGHASTVFCTQSAQKDWHQRLGSGVHADAIMDRIVHNTLWIETGTFNMREHTAVN